MLLPIMDGKYASAVSISTDLEKNITRVGEVISDRCSSCNLEQTTYVGDRIYFLILRFSVSLCALRTFNKTSHLCVLFEHHRIHAFISTMIDSVRVHDHVMCMWVWEV